ncbi:hypothetical protein B1VFA_054 [Rhizobium phage B1VFA]|nr:hypothetical protein B1VFA_054 [Rhizobium phage B1VFA]
MLRLPLTLPIHERTRLRSSKRTVVVQQPEIPPAGSALLLSDGATFALTDAPTPYDLAVHSAGDRALSDLPLRTETTADDFLLVITTAGPALVTLGDLLNILET